MFNTSNLVVNALNFGFTHYFIMKFKNTSKMKCCHFSFMQIKYWNIPFDICSAF